MRFDDRLETALRRHEIAGDNPAHSWRQLIDILAQDPRHFSVEAVSAGLMKARALFSQVDERDRLASVQSLTGRLKSAPLVQFLASDKPEIASAAITGANLTDDQWEDIIPMLPVRARGFLRNRNSLGPKTRNALIIWSSVDFVLPNPTEDSNIKSTQIIGSDRVDPTQIADIVARIERLRSERANMEAPELPLKGGELAENFRPITEIRFETDDNGMICWVEGAPRGAMIGVGIAQPALEDGPGPDAFGAAAFRQRMPLDNVRMRLCGALIVEGDWRINAAPFFDSFSGRFRGYRGIFRRPNIAENPHIEDNQTHNGEQLQQLVHELRTPLGAIVGFSEIIEQQLFGPVSADYRSLASNILSDAQRLLSGFDDLVMAARIDSGRFIAGKGTTDCGWLAMRLAERLYDLSESLSVNLNLSKADPVRPFATDHELSERLFSRLLAAVIIGCEPGEELTGRFRTELGHVATNRFVLTLPHKLQMFSEDELLGSGLAAKESLDEAPLLGLGFSLRLVRSLANNVGGDLRFYNETLILSLPAVQESDLHLRDSEGD